MNTPEALTATGLPRPAARVLPRTGWLRGLCHFAQAGVLAVAALALSVVVEDTYPSSMSLTVSAVILKKVWVRLEHAPQALHVTPEDIRRGWVDVAVPTVLTLRNNSDDGFLFRFDVDPRVASGAQLHGLSREVNVGAGGASVALPGHYRNGTRLALRWRVQLAAGLAPGAHHWPVSMQVDPN